MRLRHRTAVAADAGRAHQDSAVQDSADPDTARQDSAEEQRAQLAASRRRRLGLAAIGLAVSTVALAVLAGVLGSSLAAAHAADAARAQALGAARQEAVNFTTIDYRHLDSYLDRVSSGAIGTFKKEFTDRAASLRTLLHDSKVVATGQVLAAGISSASADRAVVLAIVDESVTNTAAPKGAITRYRMKLTLDRVGDRWLVSDVYFPVLTGAAGGSGG